MPKDNCKSSSSKCINEIEDKNMKINNDFDKRASTIAKMFDQVAGRYDVINTLLTAGQAQVWRAAVTAALEIKPGMKILDVAAGTGTSAAAFVKAGAEVVPCDISLGMLAEGKKRHPKLPFMYGDALDLPFSDSSFDAVTCSFGLRNVSDVPLALREMRRVTKPGGKIVICEFSTPVHSALQIVYGKLLKNLLPRVAHLAGGNKDAYQYLADTILAWPGQIEIAGLFSEAGWREIEFRNISFGIVALHRARN